MRLTWRWILVAHLAFGAWAQEPAPVAPVRAARLTFVAGAVRVDRSDNTAEDQAVINMPLYEGTRLVTEDYGQAEVEFEDGSMVRLTPRSALSIDLLGVSGGAARTELTLLGGLAYFELRKPVAGGYAVQAGGVEMTPAENTSVRVSFDDPPATFAVLTGSAKLQRGADGFQTVVKEGESLRADGKDGTRYFLNAEVTEQSWDRWNEERDASAADEGDRRTSARDGFSGDQGYGWADLDANGSWYDVPGTGQVWQPNVADEQFDPYGWGAWTYGTVGYVWSSGYSWGWTPFRCGRWVFFAGFGWAWVPGRSCGTYGYGGEDWGGVRVGRGPVHYRPVQPPLKGPGKVHPILIVHGPDGARPPTRVGGPVRIGGVNAVPLQPVGGGSHGGSALGMALERDFPIDRKTGKPAHGVEHTPLASAGTLPMASGWQAVQTSGNTGKPSGNAGNPSGNHTIVHPANGGGVGTPAHTTPLAPEPVHTPVAPAPVHTAPPPAPVHTAPAPGPTPARNDSKPKA